MLHKTSTSQTKPNVSDLFCSLRTLRMNMRSLQRDTDVCSPTFGGSLPAVAAHFILRKLQEVFHWWGPSLLGSAMVTVLARAGLSDRNKHMRAMHKHTLQPEFPTRVGRWASPPWPRGLTSRSWAVIKADKQVELYYQTARYQLQELPLVLQRTGKEWVDQKGAADTLRRRLCQVFTQLTDDRFSLLDVQIESKDFCRALVEIPPDVRFKLTTWQRTWKSLR